MLCMYEQDSVKEIMSDRSKKTMYYHAQYPALSPIAHTNLYLLNIGNE